MSTNSFKKKLPISYSLTNDILQDMALNNPQGLICHKTQVKFGDLSRG